VFAVDSAAGFPLNLGAGELAPSTAPIGTGDGEISHFLGLDHPTPDIVHPVAGLSIEGALPVGADQATVVTTRLRQPPSGPAPVAPGRTLLTGAYWIVDLLGDSSEMSGDYVLTFPGDEILEWMQASPGDLELYRRSKNADTEAWSLVATADAANAATDQVRFNGLSLPEGQLAIAVPEPGGLLGLVAGVAGLAALSRRRRRR
jgi:hypothetical protein